MESTILIMKSMYTAKTIMSFTDYDRVAPDH